MVDVNSLCTKNLVVFFHVCNEVTVLLYKADIPSHFQYKVIFPGTAKIMVTYSSGTAVKDRVEIQLKLQLSLVAGALW
jgi:hypothetical protein